MGYFLDNWGSFASLLGLIITTIGLIVVFRRAGEARTSAAAAAAASRETRKAIVRVLTVADVQRAIGLIDRLKSLHRDSKWDTSVGHYADLRHMFADINATHPAPTEEVHATLREAIQQITVMENSVDRALRAGSQPVEALNFNERLNTIQQNLAEIASSTYFAGYEAR